MPIRVVSDEESNKPVANRRNRWLVVTAAVLAVILAVIVALTVSRDPVVGTADSSPSAPGAPSGANAWVEARRDTVVDEVAPGLARCQSRVEGVNSNAVHGWGTEFPRTLEGAVAQSAEAVQLASSAAMWTDPEARAALFSQGFSPEAVQFQLMRRGINAAGSVVDPAGNVVPTQTWHEAGYPRYGAYKILNTNRNADGSLDEVFIQWWIPKVEGIGKFEDLSLVEISWQSWTLVAQWHDGDFISYGWYDMLPPWPVTKDRINVSFAERATVVGNDGWCVPLDGVGTEIIPGSVLAK